MVRVDDRPAKSVRLTRRGRVALLLAVVVFVAVILGGGGLLIGKALHHGGGGGIKDYAGTGTGRVVVEVKSGDSASAIARTLAAKGVVRSAGAFVQAANANGKAGQIQPGFYALRSMMSGQSALTLMLNPTSQVQSRVTIPEGTSLKSLLPILAKQGHIPQADLQAVIDNPAGLGLPSYANGKPEGFLFPSTYEVPPGTTATALLTMMVQRFAQTASEVNLVAGAKALGYTPRQIVIIASIIERESASPVDAPKVARVFYNRLKAGMSLGSEFTKRYAGNDPTSPYNTYTHKGFPPGPYDSPGKATLTAALHPTPGDWLFFVTLPKEGTKFTNSDSEFGQLSKQCVAEGGCK